MQLDEESERTDRRQREHTASHPAQAATIGEASRVQAAPQRPFGRRGEVDRYEPFAMPPAFGRRVRAPISHVSLQKERLRGLYAELWTIFADPAPLGIDTPITFEETDLPHIRLGPDARIEIDMGGAYVLQRLEQGHAVYTVTTSDIDRLMDFVVAHLARSAGTQNADLARVERSVGKSIRDVERLLILSTLRHCQGNRRRTAGMLGISLSALRSKLYSYWTDLTADARTATSRKPANLESSATVDLTFLDC